MASQSQSGEAASARTGLLRFTVLFFVIILPLSHLKPFKTEVPSTVPQGMARYFSGYASGVKSPKTRRHFLLSATITAPPPKGSESEFPVSITAEKSASLPQNVRVTKHSSAVLCLRAKSEEKRLESRNPATENPIKKSGEISK